ncbi:hypothetical protein [Streptomyces sp. NPDC092903]|uniref:hypothetical protein n=1 Tax=Streptomyces sp. NPDC092903 TaxID=3366017 RepID=UPI0037F3D162
MDTRSPVVRWWEAERGPADADPEAVGVDGCVHARVLDLRVPDGGEVVARLCPECGDRLPATDPEPVPECTHEERLEVRADTGEVIAYLCAANGCGAHLTVEEVHGRAGKWLRPAASYYPRPRNPLVPAPVPEGEEPTKPALSPGTRRLLANVGAAGAGYGLGLVPLLGGWIEECGRTTSIGGALVLGGGICLVVAHVWDRRTRHWHPVLALVARIPLMSALTALALYAPASQF